MCGILMVIVTLNILVNKKAKEGEPREWISLRELWSKANYNIPFNRWVKYTIHNYGIQPRINRKKTGNRGQPLINYYVPVRESQDMLRAVERRRHIEIRTLK